MNAVLNKQHPHFSTENRNMKKTVRVIEMSVKLLMLHFYLLIGFGMTMIPLESNAQSTITPAKYWTFNGANALADSMGGGNLDFAYFNCQYTIGNNGQVGNYVTIGNNGSLVNGGALNLSSNAVSIEFLFKPGYRFNTTQLMRRADGAFGISMEYAKFTFSTSHRSTAGSTINDDLVVSLDEIGKKSYTYYMDNNWHHMVFIFDAATGQKQVWVDGELPTGFSKTVTTGTIINTGTLNFYLNHTVSYVQYNGSIDELALYNTAIPQSLIYKHYLGIQSGQPYSFTNNYSGGYPAPTPTTGSIDVNEFAPGHPSVNMDATEQMQRYPLPRFTPGHTLMKNFNWMDPKFLGGLFQPGITQQQAANNAAAIQTELAKNFNYYFHVEFGTNVFANAYVAAANANPDFKTSIITLRAQINGNSPEITSQSKSSSHYLQDASTNFLDANGNTTTNKIWRPTAPPSSYTSDGQFYLNLFNDLFTRLNRPLDIVNENGEVFPHISDAALDKDPDVRAAKVASGLDYPTFMAKKFAENEIQSYRDVFMAHPQLANTKFTEYAIDGFPQYRMKYSEARKVNSLINGQYYSTPDFYPRWPYNWRNYVSAWHGWQWIVDSRNRELAVGDQLYSPFVSAGWDVNEEANIRPAQWLGLLKCLGMTGAEFYYTGFFSLSSPWPDSRNWVWQAVMPPYAQAVTSRYEEFLRNGILMDGDVPSSFSNPTAPGYSFWTGDLRKLVVIRRHNTINKYAITGTLQPNSNINGNTENEGTATITLDNMTVKFKVRRQGSTYIYDKSIPSAPVFYQLDGWHERSHPLNWTKDFQLEAELYDNSNSQISIKTSVPSGTQAGDFTNFTSYVSWPDNTPNPTPVEYQFTPRISGNNSYYFWIRARSRNGASTSVSVQVDNQTALSIGCISDTNWTWYRYDACTQQAIQFLNQTLQNHILRLTPGNDKLEIDQALLTTDASLILNPAAPNCSAATATVTAGGSTTFCLGGNVTLTASSGTSYLWSPGGQTTQSISVNTSGDYSVTVGSGAGCNAVSNLVTVTVNPKPNATITASGSTTICSGQTITLSAPAGGSSYLWSPTAQTGSSITTGTAGTYSVTVTNSYNCSTTSSPVIVSVSSAPSATISAGGSTTFCQGGSVTLSAGAATSYLWSPGGQTTQSIQASNSGSYTVRVTNATGCTATSSATVVTVNSNPSASITASGSTNICYGSDVLLTAMGGGTYLWNTGETGSTISASAAGTYNVTVTNSNGCMSVASPVQVTVQPEVTPVIGASGPTTFQQGQSVTLTASGGVTYLWQPNGETTNSITVTTSGNYTVTAYNANGCSGTSAPVTVTVNQVSIPPATITAVGGTLVCDGLSVTLEASQGLSYAWLPGGETTPTITVNTPGTYSVTVTDTSGLGSSVATIELFAAPTPSAPVVMSTYIPNSAFQLKAYEASAYSYMWSTGSMDQAIIVNTSGTYSVQAINGYGCLSSASTMTVASTQPQSCQIADMLSVYGITKNEAVLSWNPAVTANSFEVIITEISTGQTQSLSTAGNVSFVKVTGLIQGTTYRWKVNTICNGTTLSSIEKIFTTLNGSLPCSSTPQNLSTDFVNATMAKVSWFDTQADRFVVRFREVGTLDYHYRRIYSTETGGNIHGLTPNTTYEWSVRSVCDQMPSLYSDPLQFTTPSPCPSPGPVFVSDIGFNQATIQWNPSVQADTFMVRYAISGSPDYVVIKVAGNPNMALLQISGLLPQTEYSAWVASKCLVGSTSTWGTPVNFVTQSEPSIRNTPDGGPMHLNAYPNPANYHLGYVFESDDDKPYHVKVTDMQGRLLFQEIRESNIGLNGDRIELTGYASGIYMLIVQKGPLEGRFRFNVSQ